VTNMGKGRRRYLGLEDLEDDTASTHLIGIAFEILLDRASTRGLDDITNPKHLRAFLLKAVHNKLKGNRQKAKAEKRGGKTEFVHLDASPPGHDGETKSAHEVFATKPVDTLEILLLDIEVKRRLNPGERAVVDLLFADPHLTNAQIGTKLGVTEGAVRARRIKISEKMYRFRKN